ncbi:glycosyltransferase family 2 protein [Streptococcus sp. sy004]|uniref:glycosyltransferase n=1 Tax=Streptococcus sp. sy004 TaxID=2600149 RepID=UPI0011B5470F|nr:glycosyltransferase family 2 protein [Streptococcus sp. sy004]TWT11023.1 glycosyltransferase family 2 protein [Streptococcus sp. sy004]
MMSKILTITVPSYHTEQYMDACLPTLLNEKINDRLEILIVNDGSTDGTLEKARTYERQFPDTIRVIDKKNGGHGSTINKGIELATGKYFKVVDGDDWVNTDQLVRLVEDLQDLDVDIVITPYEDHNMDTKEIKVQDFPHQKAGVLVSYDQLLKEADRLPMMHATTFKTAILKENAIHIDEKMFYVDMEYITFPMPFLQTACYLPHRVYCYRMGTAEQSVNPANFVKNREMHRQVTYQLVNLYNQIEKEYPSATRTQILKKQLLDHEFILDTHICLYVDDAKQGRQEFLDYQKRIKELNPQLWKELSSKKVKLLSVANGLFFPLLKVYMRGKAIR